LETRNYELMFIVSPELDEAALDAVLQRVHRYLDAAEAQVVSFKSWGLRRLAYTLNGQREGRYYLVLFTANSLTINDLDRDLRLVDGVLRHLITRMETEMPEPTIEEPRVPAPVAEAVPEPVAEATPEPVAEATPEPVAEATPEVEAEPTPEPTTEPEGDSPTDAE
jgi:small subunit ribosomal protein S6